MENNGLAKLAFEPQTLSEAQSLAQAYAESDLLPPQFRGRPANILLAMAKGRELGLTAIQSLQSLYVVNGKVGMPGELMLALVLKRSDICTSFRIVETTSTKCTVAAKRVGQEEQTLTFTIEDARRAGMDRQANYLKYPQNMLRWRAISNLAKLIFPDLFLGCYEESELREVIVREAISRTPPQFSLIAAGDGIENRPKGEAVSGPEKPPIPIRPDNVQLLKTMLKEKKETPQLLLDVELP